MIDIPPELLWLGAGLVVLSLALAFLVRQDWRGTEGFDWWRPIEDVVSLFLLLTMLAASLVQVVARYFLSDYLDVPWTEELSRLAMVWLAFWGAAALARSDDHINMGVVHDLMPPGAQRIMRLVSDAVTIAVMLPIVWFGWQNAIALRIIGTVSLGVPVAVFAFAIPVTGALMVLHALMLLVQRLRGRTIVSHVEPGV